MIYNKLYNKLYDNYMVIIMVCYSPESQTVMLSIFNFGYF